MKYTVGWKGLDNPHTIEVDARYFYDAKKQFLEQSLKGTDWEHTYIVSEWLSLVWAKCAEDNRKKEPLPVDFDLAEVIR